MKTTVMFDNLECLFPDEDQVEADTQATVIRDVKTGKVIEIRVFNVDYDDILVINRKGDTFAINANEYIKK